MSYKTILVHCNDTRRVSRVASVAAELAARFDAHLIGLSVSPPVQLIPAGVPGVPDVIVDNALRAAYRTSNPELRRALLDAAERAGNVGCEWRERDADGASVSATVLAAARRSDLVVVAQTDHSWPNSSHLDIDEALILGGGRPVVLVPNDGMASAGARRILVAWNDSREASRAVFDALPLLQGADDVRIVAIAADEAQSGQIEETEDICTTLRRHNVKCKATERVYTNADTGRALTQQAIAFKADFLVMGCYGHSRLRELMLGGASRYQLRNMLIPVLMSH